MGTICILFGLIIFLGSLFLGFAGANWLLSSSLATALVGVVPSEAQTYLIFVGLCGFIGLLICLNLVMHGLTYNKLVKLNRRLKHH